MSKINWVTFASGDPRTYTGLTPTFLIFMDQFGASYARPSIAEVGTSTGYYGFTYAYNGTLSYGFLLDGGSVIGTAADRYIRGSIDPIGNIDQQLGFSTDSYGTTARPTTNFGLVKRLVELWEADATFNKTTGAWSNFAKGTSTLLVEKTLANSTTQATKV